jgi:PAS domain S-box-containing protein
LLARRIERATAPSPDRAAELREKAAQLDAVFSELPLSLYIKDEAARHRRVSRGHATGYDGSTPPEPVEGKRIEEPSDFVGKTDLDLLPEANAREPYEDDLRVIETGEPIYNKEEHIERADGEDLWVTTTKVPRRDAEGGVKGLIGFSLDITERKRYERTLEDQTEELELLNRLLRHDVAHEVSAVNKRALLLKQTVEDADARDDLDEIARSGERVAELLDTVRTLMGTMLDDEVGVEPVALGPALRTELDRVRSRHDEAVVEAPDSLPDVAVAANDVLREVFRNLLTNAVYHNDTARPTVTVDVEERAETVLVRVADDGPGIPDEQKRTVFGRGESGLESPGTGIGLYLVDTIVEGYGGDVWVEDNDPRGAVVCVRLPKAE